MAQFQVYLNRHDARDPAIPYLLDVQSDLLDALETRVVVPLARSPEAGRGVTQLNPELAVLGERLLMNTPALGVVPVTRLGQPVADLSSHRSEILAALDFLLMGF